MRTWMCRWLDLQIICDFAAITTRLEVETPFTGDLLEAVKTDRVLHALTRTGLIISMCSQARC